MEFLAFLVIVFIVWLFTSKTKSQDLSNLGQGISKTINVANEVAGTAEKISIKLHEDSKKILVKTILEGMKNRSIPLSERSILEAFKNRPDLIDMAMTEWASQTISAQNKLRVDMKALNTLRKDVQPPPKKNIVDGTVSDLDDIAFELDELIRQSKVQSAAENFKHINFKQDEKKFDSELVRIEIKPDLVVDANEPEKLGEVFIVRKNKLDEALKNFILIRFFLTGKKDFPNLTCVQNKLLDTFSVKQVLGNARIDPKDYFLQMWNYYLDDLKFDESKIKKIKGIYHFTHVSNLKNIFEHGLLTREFLDSSKISYSFNDDHRWDGVKDSVSLSISHPNHKMFMKYRKNTVEKDWVVLKIKDEILCGATDFKNPELRNYDYLNKAIFCKKNAASFSEKNTPVESRKKYSAFLEMFESPIGMTLPTYTVDNQAEVLYQGCIPKAFIARVFIQEADSRLDWIKRMGVPVLIAPELFKTR